MQPGLNGLGMHEAAQLATLPMHCSQSQLCITDWV
jgi:hypothetical protein